MDTPQQFVRDLLSTIDELWSPEYAGRETLAHFMTQPGWLIARCADHPYHSMMTATLERLRARYPGDTLGALAADLYFRTGHRKAQEARARDLDMQKRLSEQAGNLLQVLSGLSDGGIQGGLSRLNASGLRTTLRLLREGQSFRQAHQEGERRRRLSGLRLVSVLNAVIVEYAPPDILGRIAAHLRNLTEALSEKAKSIGCIGFTGHPMLQDCLNLLVGLKSSPELFGLLEELNPVPPWHSGNDWTCLVHQGDVRVTNTSTQTWHSGNDWTYLVHDAAEPFLGLLRNLSAYGALDYEIFQHIARLIPYTFMDDTAYMWERNSSVISEAFSQQLEAYRQRLIAEVAPHLSEKNCHVILAYRGILRGASWLLLAARLHTARQLKDLVGVGGPDSPRTVEQAVIRIARAEDIEPASGEERQQLLAQLREFPQATLKALFGVATHARRLLCEALDWQEALPLVMLVEEFAARRFPSAPYGERISMDVPNSTDPLSGVLDVVAVRGALECVPEAVAQEMLALLCKAKAGVENTAMLVRAAGGWNRAAVEQGLKRNGQVSIKAYGLLPLTRGEDEVLERYLRLQKIARVGNAFIPGRRATHAAAVQAALANLAQVAGYTDAAHLEWAMEMKVVQDMALTERMWTAGEYRWSVALDGIEAAIRVTRAGRTLKSIPKEVRANAGYQEAKEAVTRLREHISRLRRGLLERLLVTGEMLTPEELSRLLRLPTARTLLSRLILRSEDGVMGLLEADEMALCGLDNSLHPIVAPVMVAHPYHLFQSGMLADWQREIVHRRIVQPVKQAFRELYVLTPAEQETRTYSRRFAGRTIDGAMTTGLLASRGWRVRRHDEAYAYKIFPGLRAVFTLPHNAHYLGEPSSEATIDEISFEPYGPSSPYASQAEHARIPLELVSPLIFSEVMRDADLVVAVAGRAGGTYLSNEIYTRVGELVRALLDELGLQGVTVDRHYAYVQGKLACYRVHLGSAAIHIEPGSYLCIVPDRWGQTHERLFLPFVDDANSKISEVISKILLLLSDDQIKDESILRQIRSQHPQTL